VTPEEILQKIKIGMSREEVRNALGEPDAVGGTSRKYHIPAIYKYGQVELHFSNSRYDDAGRGRSFAGPLVMVYMENADHTEGWTLLK
jgi:hypothetical protein